MTIFLAGCATAPSVSAPPIQRTIPHEANLVPDEVPAPDIGPGDDARVAWKLEEAARIEANHRLRTGRANVRKARLKAVK